MGASIDNLFTAILNDDRPRVKKLLKSDRGLATQPYRKSQAVQNQDLSLDLRRRYCHCIWPPPAIALKLHDCCWRRVPIRWRPPIIVAAARCITQPMATLPAVLGIRTGK